jgi:hypothetical protein
MLKTIYLWLPGKPLLMFGYLYFARMGFLDGKAGLYFCALRAMHELNICAKLFAMRTQHAPDARREDKIVQPNVF